MVISHSFNVRRGEFGVAFSAGYGQHFDSCYIDTGRTGCETNSVA